MATKKSTETKKATKKAAADKKPKAALGAKKTVARKATNANAEAKAKKAPSKVKLTPEQLFVKTQEMAYFLAEKDGFRLNPTHYWIDAETEVARQK